MTEAAESLTGGLRGFAAAARGYARDLAGLFTARGNLETP